MTQDYLNKLTSKIIGAAIEVHKELGPGLLEGIYEKCLIHLLKDKGLNVSSQQKVPLNFRGLRLERRSKNDRNRYLCKITKRLLIKLLCFPIVSYCAYCGYIEPFIYNFIA